MEKQFIPSEQENINKGITTPNLQLEKNNQTSEFKFDEIMSIYKNLCEDNRVYNNIVWQFPTALIAANGLLFQALDKNLPIILLIISIINFGLIHAIFKLGHNQRAIINAMKIIENQYFKKIYNEKISKFLPDFNSNSNFILRMKSSYLISYILLIINIIYFISSLFRVFPNLIK